MKSLSIQIHEALGCPPSRVKEILIELAGIKRNLYPDADLPSVWLIYKPTYIEYGKLITILKAITH